MNKIFILLVIMWGNCLYAQMSPGTAKKWQKDLRKLEYQLADRHVDLYHSISKDSFSQVINDLYDDIPNLTEPQVLVRFAQMIALVGDGHTSFYPGNQKKKWFGFFPIKLWSFSDGTYVIATFKEHSDLLGKRLIEIDNTPIEKAFKKLSSTIGADNDMGFIYTIPFQLCRPELLRVLNISKSSEKATFKFEKNVEKTLKRHSFKDLSQPGMDNGQ